MQVAITETTQWSLLTHSARRRIYSYCDMTLMNHAVGRISVDRESAAAKTIIRSFVDAGESSSKCGITPRIFTLWVWDERFRSCCSTDRTMQTMLIDGPKIPKISNYHSIEFHNDYMKIWRYFDVGEGMNQSYNQLSIEPAVDLLLPYSKTDKRIRKTHSGKEKVKKNRVDRKLCTLLFCNEVECTENI